MGKKKRYVGIIGAAMILLSQYPVKAACGEDGCYAKAARQYGVSAHILKAIARKESNLNPAATNYNTNGTVDVGLMQINSIWRDRLGPTWEYLYDPCTNVMVGAWILRQCIEDYGYTWEAVGCYHSRTPEKRDAYAARIAAILQQEETP